ncbi:MAG: class I SAM-dependent methyltransferase [Symploca sp. SIO3C6]|nr:class I SAM-dependent methyltransferase [Symploca sp. SIO3C6]
MNTEDRVQWIYSSQNNQELIERYSIWAKDYDQDLTDVFVYVSPQKAVEAFLKYVSQDAKILDAGAGTGLVGQLLHQQGYHNLEAMDMSQGMLEEAGKKKVYTALHQGILGEPLDFSADYFDATVSIGVFTPGHAPSSAFDELIRITKPGGYIIFSMRPDFYENSDFSEKQSALAKSGQWELVEIGEKFQCLPKGEPEIELQIWVYQVVR